LLPLDLAIPTIAFSLVVFLIGGTIKGTLGIGMPLFIVPVMVTVTEPVTVIGLLFVPILASNLLQMVEGGYYRITLHRFKSLLLSMLAATIVGAHVLAQIDAKAISVILGCIVATFCILQLLPLRPSVPKRLEAYLSPAVGAIAGLLGGVSTLFGPPLVMYLIALRLTKDEFIAAIAQLFFVAGTVLYITLAVIGALTVELVIASAFVTGPVAIGLVIGRKIRSRIGHEAVFQRVLVAVLLIAGLNLVRRGLQ
jgi:uncharacterized membrane protein YfcA